MTEVRPRRVALAGVVDIANYGDQLFPLLAAHRLARHGIEVVAVAPTAAHRLRPDALTPVALDGLLSGEVAVDGILIGGGNILYNLRTDHLAGKRRDSWAGQGLHTGLWLGAVLAACIHDIPFAFNAPGLPYPFSSVVAAEVLRPCLEAADVVSLRDAASVAQVAALSPRARAVPDTAIDLAEMWPRDSLKPFERAFHAEAGLGDTPYVAVHLRAARDAGVQPVAVALDALCARHGVRPVLVAIGDDMADTATAQALKAAMTADALVLDGEASLRRVAAVIAGARAYVGASLHGYITAAAYGTPGVMIPAQAQRKFAGFLDWMERPGDLARDWDQACALASAHLTSEMHVRVPDTAQSALNDHWTAVAAMLDDPGRRSAQRAEALRVLTRRMAQRGGPAGLLAPFTRSRATEAA